MNINENLLQSGFHQVSASQTNRHTHFQEEVPNSPLIPKFPHGDDIFLTSEKQQQLD